MNLEQLMNLANISNYYIFWYGANIAEDYFDGITLKDEYIELPSAQGRPTSEDQIYLIMYGLNANKCKYHFAARLIPTDTPAIYRWERVPIALDEYAGRLVFKRETRFSFYNSSAIAKYFIVDEIWGKQENRTVPQFTDYDSVELSFVELKEVIDEHYSDYYKALSSVKGIYMIIDGNTGKQYIGSAYGEDGIWGRWESYVSSFHGNNIELIKLYEEHGEQYFHKFKYLILQIAPMRISDREIIDLESKYKKRFMTREFGLNAN